MLRLCGATMWGSSFPISKLKQPKNPMTLYVDTEQLPATGPDEHIYLYQEPFVITNLRPFILTHWKKFKYILTYDDTLLHLPNAHKFIPACTWITQHDAESIQIEQKKFQISSLTGAKAFTAGHKFRLEVLKRASEFSIPSTFFRTNVPPMTSKSSDKIHLFREYQFSLIIENSRLNNCFTEKLCDCLYTKTIPIYYGAPNISEYFDTTGWIILENESVETLLAKIRTLDESWYQRHLDTVMKNYESVLQYISYEGNINHVLDTLDY
jgi:hypothetical protein